MFSLIDRVRTLIGRLFYRRHRSDTFSTVVDSASMSTQPVTRELVVVGSGEKAKWVKFRCPCGCGEVIALNLMESHYPRWSATRDQANQLTLSPSVHSTTCGAHFFIRANRVEWCP